LPPSDPTLDNYRFVIESGFVGYFVNSVVVTAGAVVPAVLVSFMAAYAIVRGWRIRFLRIANGLFLMGLAIPLQATVIPLYLIIIRLRLFDSLMALILPSIAFAIPLSVLVLANFIRDVPKELFEAMRIDGATEWGTLWRLAAPLTRPAIITVTIYNALTIWNGFLLPLILTQSPERKTLPLALATFQGQWQRQRPGHRRRRRPHHTAHPGPVRLRPPPTAHRPRRRLQRIAVTPTEVLLGGSEQRSDRAVRFAVRPSCPRRCGVGRGDVGRIQVGGGIFRFGCGA
jgi:ABC-type spermidine/putrescine transport system permease subunit II